MTSAREQILAAIHGLVPIPTDGLVLRYTEAPMGVPLGGLILIREGRLELINEFLSPLRYEYNLSVDIEICVQGDTGSPSLGEKLDQLLSSTRNAFADRSLGGLCDWLQALPPDINIEQPTALDSSATGEPIMAARLPIVVTYTTTSDIG